MGQDSGGPPPATATAKRSALSADEVRAFTDRAPRCTVALQVLCTIPDDDAGSEFLDTELVNLSASGMLLAAARPLVVGSIVDFSFKLGDGLVVLSGRAEVVRTVAEPPRMGLRFVALEGDARTFVERLIDASDAAPELPAGTGLAAPVVEFAHGTIRVRLTAATAKFFTYNPLLHIGVGGCFVPSAADVPLGTGYQMDVIDETERLILRCKAKVAAKQERWVGLRFLDVERSALQALRAEVAKLSGARTR
jgi:c-di-GMP-binding flagellar brake protein YcgR